MTYNKIEQWAEDRNLIKGSTVEKQLLKLVEEVGELTEAVNKDKLEHAKSELGDCVVVLTILAKQLDSDINKCADIAYNKIKDRKGQMINGVFVKEQDL